MSIPWVEAWHEALYGPTGLYVRDAPHAHFSTATSPGLVEVLAEAVVTLMRRERLTHLVDVAAGGGELGSAVRTLGPDLDVTCVEVRPRPAGLDARVGWLRSPGGAALPAELRSLTGVLVLAHEWLDNIPCVIADRTADGLREVCVAPDGTESLGSPVAAQDAAWADQWWPEREPRHAEGWPTGGFSAESRQFATPRRVEIGRARDAAWADLCSRIDDGLAVAVDYGHLREARPQGGSLMAYRSGNVVVPVPDGTCDLTARVAVDSLRHDRLLTQSAMLAEIGLRANPVDLALAHSDPVGYVRALSRRSAIAALTDPRGLGGFWWVLRPARGVSRGPAPAGTASR